MSERDVIRREKNLAAMAIRQVGCELAQTLGMTAGPRQWIDSHPWGVLASGAALGVWAGRRKRRRMRGSATRREEAEAGDGSSPAGRPPEQAAAQRRTRRRSLLARLRRVLLLELAPPFLLGLLQPARDAAGRAPSGSAAPDAGPGRAPSNEAGGLGAPA